MSDVEQRIKTAFEPYRASVSLDEVLAAAFEVAPTPHHRQSPLRGRRMALLMATAAVLGICVAILPALSSDPLHGALAIERNGDMLYVEVLDALAGPDAMTNDLRAAGLDATVSVLPVSPSLVGRWVNVMNLSGADQDPRIVDLFEQIESRVESLRIPADFSSAIGLYVGRPARSGERWEISAEADSPDLMTPGQELACLGLASLTPAEVDRILVDIGYRVVWSVLDPELPSSEVVPTPPATGIVFEARLIGPDLLDVRVAALNSDLVQQEASRNEEGC